ncbi:UDP-N-acetyl-D-mannosaminuronic acid dehydrogenase [Natronoarchaeum philippinense]|uniref:UDP-N-acetyl-D-mannosamine dehydrogenase n=1 Tax=Natronoarchaeum philippinense TaxID=558529 RepID=A0A285P6S1_NATPI|nr:nucleotide sugar dehydrogenase [Natronoarchaeum philippinense]SNZ16967.1 UDP-N-acetyl-D-mannosaminuronic acid dehydrogenase [Natronoarchaeum philippinense]
MSRSTTALYDADASTDEQRRAFRSGEIPVAVYGLGKMGLPLATVYAETCGNVIGADIDENVVETVNAGECHVKREPGLADIVAETVESGALRAVSDPAEAAGEARVHVVIVPTLLSEDDAPDLSILREVVDDIAVGLAPGDLVVVESTVPPRTCSDVVGPRLREKSGLDANEFGLAFCPERTASGRAIEDIRGAYPKVVGGVDAESRRAAQLVYDAINEAGTIPVSDATTAEAVKVFEGVYRDVNIALANELARMADELAVDVTEAIEVANTQPFCDIHDPGPGVGGHCIPYYPYFLINGLDSWNRLLSTAREVNDEMPAFTVRKLAEELATAGKNVADATVLVLGLTYRAGVEETRASPAIPITERLEELGAEVVTVDPMLDDADGFAGRQIPIGAIHEQDADAAVLVTAHEEFEAIDWAAFERSLVVVDGQQALDLSETPHRQYTIGVGRGAENAGEYEERRADESETAVPERLGDGGSVPRDDGC